MLTYDEINKLVVANNQLKDFSNEYIICLIWKETNFKAGVKNSSSSATGLMQMTKAAVLMVNKLHPKGTQYKHSDMTDSALNIQAGSIYLDIAKNQLSGVDKSYGAGSGYQKKILLCEIDLKKDAKHPSAALQLIRN